VIESFGQIEVQKQVGDKSNNLISIRVFWTSWSSDTSWRQV